MSDEVSAVEVTSGNAKVKLTAIWVPSTFDGEAADLWPMRDAVEALAKLLSMILSERDEKRDAVLEMLHEVGNAL